jgi:polyisoprenoid-binding protein YceI
MRRAKGTIHLFTFKEGVLSRVAHDLEFRLDRFEITLDGDAVKGEFDLDSLVLEGPVEGGVVRPESYDAGKRAEVEKAMHHDILHTAKHPTARYQGRAVPHGEGFSVSGDLELAGRRAPVFFEARHEGGAYRSQIDIEPSRWGIAQYKALLGAIRLKDRVRIELALTDAEAS